MVSDGDKLCPLSKETSGLTETEIDVVNCVEEAGCLFSYCFFSYFEPSAMALPTKEGRRIAELKLFDIIIW